MGRTGWRGALWVQHPSSGWSECMRKQCSKRGDTHGKLGDHKGGRVPENKHMRGGAGYARLEKELQVCRIMLCLPFSTEGRAPLDSPSHPGNTWITKDTGSHCPPMITGIPPSSIPSSGLCWSWTLLTPQHLHPWWRVECGGCTLSQISHPLPCILWFHPEMGSRLLVGRQHNSEHLLLQCLKTYLPGIIYHLCLYLYLHWTVEK